MTTTHNRWIGGATAVAQVRTTQITGAATGSKFTTTIVGEDGSSQSVVTTMTNSTLADQATLYRNTLAASSLSEFQKLTYSVDGVLVTITASVAGRPFTMTTGTFTGSASVSNASPTANAGPNDWNTTANWSRGSVPTNDDVVYFTSGSNDVLYGLNQSAVSLDQMIVSPGYRGNIGTSVAPLLINADAGGEKGMTLGGSGFYYNISGDIENMNVTKNLGTLKLGTKIKNTNLIGRQVGGSIELDCRTSDNGGNVLRMSGVSPSCIVEIPATAVQQGNIFMDSGRVNTKASGPAQTKAIISGTGYLCCKESGKINGTGATHTPATITVLGGATYAHESDADLASGGVELAVFDGVADFRRVRAATADSEFITLGNVEIYGGSLDASGSALLVNLTSVKNFGGKIDLPTNSTLAGTAKVSG